MKRYGEKPSSGAVLVVTLLVVVVLAVAVASFMQSVMSDRHASRSVVNYQHAEWAAEAGLAEAVGRLRAVAAATNYVTGEETSAAGTRPFIRPLQVEEGSWAFSGEAVYLDSGFAEGEAAKIPTMLASNGATMVEMGAAYRTLVDDDTSTTRYAFRVREAGARQNLGWWGQAVSQGWPTNAGQLALLRPGLDGQPPAGLTASVSNAVRSLRSYATSSVTLDGLTVPVVTVSNRLVSPASLNAVNTNLQGRAGRYFFTLSNPVSPLAPDGRLRLNLAALQQYLRGPAAGATAQGPQSARVQLVTDLLNPAEAAEGPWGGGSVAWLATSGKYDEVRQRQITANIIDYLDDDLVPTADSASEPGFLGVESRTEGGAVRGHPALSFLGFGLEFRFSGGTDGTPLRLASTRVLSSVGLVNPWSAPVPTGEYRLELEVTVSGSVSGVEGAPELAAYFTNRFNTNLDVAAWAGASLGLHTGVLSAPQAAAPAALREFAEGEAPPAAGATFRDLRFRVDVARLFYRSAPDASPALVGVVRGTPEWPADPATLTLPDKPGTVVYPPPPENGEGEGLFLAGDPRLAFTEGAYRTSRSVPDGNYIKPAPQDLPIFAEVGEEFDGRQGTADSVGSLADSSMTNFLHRLVPAAGFLTVGELGYISTGLPWQTLNLMPANESAGSADWNLLDYVQAGQRPAAAGLVMPVLPVSGAAGNPVQRAALVADGGYNVNTRERATLAAVLTNLVRPSGVVNDPASVLAGLSPEASPSAFGSLAALHGLVKPEWRNRKFKREDVVRLLGNVATSHSRLFTVYSLGEFLRGGQQAAVVIEADVLVRSDPQTGKLTVEVLRKHYR
jgi:hypothetical protein